MQARGLKLVGIHAVTLITLNGVTSPPAQGREPRVETSSEAPQGRDLAGVDLGAFRFSRWGETGGRWGAELHIVSSGFETTQGSFYFGGITRDGLRTWALDGFSLQRTGSVQAGVRLGPLRLEATIGAILISADRIDGAFSAQLLSPRVGAGAGLTLPGGALLLTTAESEYVWRWLGPDYRTLDLHLSLLFPVEKTWLTR